MNAGDFRNRISIQQLTIAADSEGFQTETWQEYKKVWAKIQNLHGSEFFQAKQVNSKASVKFTIRYTAGLTTDMKIVYNNKSYNIIYIDNIQEENKYIEMLCEVVE